MTTKENDPHFEIQFFESILKKSPNYIDVIEILGCLYTEVGLIENGLRMDELAVEIKPQDPTAYYNLACSQALLGQTEESLESLKQSIELGYNDLEWLLQDDDMISLHSHPKFQEIVNHLKALLNKDKC